MSNTDLVAVMKKTLQHILKEHPENESIIKVFGPILLCEEKLLSEHALTRAPSTNKQKDANAPFLDVSNISMNSEKVVIFSQQLLNTMEQVLPHLKAEIQLVKECLKPAAARQLCKKFLANKEERQELINTYIDKTLFPYLKKMDAKNATAAATGTKPSVEDIKKKKEALYSIMELLLTRLSHIFVARAARALPKAKDDINRNHCPYCGDRPSMSIVREKEGQRDLLCSSCGRTWRFKRTSCPNCLIEEQKNLQLIYHEKNTKERAILCESCNHYLLEIDVRERDIPIECITAFSLGMSYLDAIMHENKAIPFNNKF